MREVCEPSYQVNPERTSTTMGFVGSYWKSFCRVYWDPATKVGFGSARWPRPQRPSFPGGLSQSPAHLETHLPGQVVAGASMAYTDLLNFIGLLEERLAGGIDIGSIYVSLLFIFMCGLD